jgi:hypothetical protein
LACDFGRQQVPQLLTEYAIFFNLCVHVAERIVDDIRQYLMLSNMQLVELGQGL